ncbi:hypothetical protein G6F65_016008 [Rhizopus arrhizus]|nr:hypothetical protein G6F65_016008 [Rhizopus arrhizus]
MRSVQADAYDGADVRDHEYDRCREGQRQPPIYIHRVGALEHGVASTAARDLACRQRAALVHAVAMFAGHQVWINVHVFEWITVLLPCEGLRLATDCRC